MRLDVYLAINTNNDVANMHPNYHCRIDLISMQGCGISMYNVHSMVWASINADANDARSTLQ
jgi:hypothetical protein